MRVCPGEKGGNHRRSPTCANSFRSFVQWLGGARPQERADVSPSLDYPSLHTERLLVSDKPGGTATSWAAPCSDRSRFLRVPAIACPQAGGRGCAKCAGGCRTFRSALREVPRGGRHREPGARLPVDDPRLHQALLASTAARCATAG